MKSPVLVIFNDLHIKRDNRAQIVDIVTQLIKLVKSLGFSEVYGLGDFFESRNEQPLFNLETLDIVLEMFRDEGIVLNAIPGNHDKVNYVLEESYLDPFRFHPSMNLIRDSSVRTVVGLKNKVLLIPFFSNERWLEEVGRYKGEGNLILFSHIAFNGSINNDKTKVESTIDEKVASRFSKVFLGHYHDYHQVGSNVFHLPSTHQHNFGENDHKGFTILYDDLSFDIFPSKFKKFSTVDVDITDLSMSGINNFISDVVKECGDETNLRVLLTGRDDQLKVVDFNKLRRFGVEVKVVRGDIETSINSAENGEIVEFNKESIIEEFGKFCSSKGYSDQEVGLYYLSKKLKLSESYG